MLFLQLRNLQGILLLDLKAKKEESKVEVQMKEVIIKDKEKKILKREHHGNSLRRIIHQMMGEMRKEEMTAMKIEKEKMKKEETRKEKGREKIAGMDVKIHAGIC